MTNRTMSCGHFSIVVADAWDDITQTVGIPNAPLTVGSAQSGVGALQLSAAIYKGGPLPCVTADVLSGMLDDFALARNLEAPFDRHIFANKVTLVGESFHSGGDFIRLWYASDGKNIVMATYVCEWDKRELESKIREAAVRSLWFH